MFLLKENPRDSNSLTKPKHKNYLKLKTNNSLVQNNMYFSSRKISNKITAFWDMMPCSAGEAHRRFGRTFCLLLQARSLSQASNQHEAAGKHIAHSLCHLLLALNIPTIIPHNSYSEGSSFEFRIGDRLFCLITLWFSSVPSTRRSVCFKICHDRSQTLSNPSFTISSFVTSYDHAV